MKVNADIAPTLSRRFEVQSIPTLLIMRDGHVVDRQIGATPVDRLRTWVEQNAGRVKVTACPFERQDD